MQEGVLAAQGIGIYFVYRHAAYEHRLILLRKLPSFGVRLQDLRLYRHSAGREGGLVRERNNASEEAVPPPPQKIEL